MESVNRIMIRILLLVELTQFFLFHYWNVPAIFGIIKDVILLLLCLNYLLKLRSLKFDAFSVLVFIIMLSFYSIKLAFGWNEKAYFIPRIFLWYLLLKSLDLSVGKTHVHGMLKVILIASVLMSFVFALFDLSSWLVSHGYPSSTWDEAKLNHSWYSSNFDVIRFGGFMVSPIAFGLFLLWYFITYREVLTNIEWITVVFGILGTQSRLIILFFLWNMIRTIPQRYRKLSYLGIGLILVLLFTRYYTDLVFDRSALGHYASFSYGISLLYDIPPIGYDLGYFGSFVNLGLLSGNVIESGMLLLLIEHGWLIGVVLIFYLFRELRLSQSRKYFAAVLVISLFLPVFQYLSVLLLPALVNEN